MQVVHTIAELRSTLAAHRNPAFVPTMAICTQAIWPWSKMPDAWAM
jgi:hypothetical protein